MTVPGRGGGCAGLELFVDVLAVSIAAAASAFAVTCGADASAFVSVSLTGCADAFLTAPVSDCCCSLRDDDSAVLD